MHKPVLIYSLATLLLGAQASWMRREQPDWEVVTWTVPGARYRPVEATFSPETVTHTKETTYYPSQTIQLRAAPSERQIKRSFLNNWSYKGCAQDDDGLPTLASPFPYQLAQEDVSSASCNHFCDERGSTVAALQNGDECWCGEIADTINFGLESACDTPCAAFPGEKCGGTNGLSVYVKA